MVKKDVVFANLYSTNNLKGYEKKYCLVRQKMTLTNTKLKFIVFACQPAMINKSSHHQSTKSLSQP